MAHAGNCYTYGVTIIIVSMNLERSFFITFFANYLINTVAASLVALIPASTKGGIFTPQYITFVILAVIIVAFFAWWTRVNAIKNGAIFGIMGFVVAIATVFVTGVAGVLAQTGSFSNVIGILPNFWPFIASWSTLVLLGYWVIPPVVLGWMKSRKAPMAASTM
jgi:hypothetical protein